MQSSLPTLSLPPSMAEEDALHTIRLFSPELRFHADEQHFPSAPDRFQERARFRESRPGTDRGWSHRAQSWSTGDRQTAEAHGVPWPQIVSETLKHFPSDARIDPPTSTNLRPRDDGNCRGRGSTSGFFMQRAENLPERASGVRPGDAGELPAPVLVDTYYDANLRTVRVLYWFFYELNFWRFFLTHEGDWEHISLLFTENAFRRGHAPEIAYFAQHNEGLPVLFERLGFVQEGHPTVFVDRNGHPCTPAVPDPHRYPHRWRTWMADFAFVSRSPWRDFAGAWGEVGESTHTTGPLGPYFKRHRDDVRVAVRDGRLYVRLDDPRRS